LNAAYKQKEDEWYDLGQQLIAGKEELANMINEMEIVREENAYLNKSTKELTEK
jgi:hypothetical protein